jgi:hypothetical protein
VCTYPVIEQLAVDVRELYVYVSRSYRGFSIGVVETYMSETIPLSPTLSVQSIGIIICYILHERLDLMLERLSSKCRRLRDIHRQTSMW